MERIRTMFGQIGVQLLVHFVVIVLHWSSCTGQTKDRPNKMLFVLFDGFRWDYVRKFDLKGFKKFEERGARTEALRPQYPSLSLPGYYSLITGMYPEQHGIVSNSMYDPDTKEVFDALSIGVSAVSSTWWEKADPLWVSATRAGLRTHVYLWPGCNVRINGVLPASCLFGSPTYYTTFNLERYLDEALRAFEDDQADLVMIYHESPDFQSQFFGPDSWMTKKICERLDEVLTNFMQKMDSKGLDKKINFMLTSDHGMTAVDGNFGRSINLNLYINMDDIVKMLDYGANSWLFPEPGKLEEIYDALRVVQGLNVIKKADIPAEYRVKGSERTPPLLVEAKPGYYIMPILFSTKQVPFTVFPYYKGYHGFDSKLVPDMRGIFIAAGPEIGKNVTIDEIELVDVHSLASYLLHLPPTPTNGSFEHVSGMLLNPDIES